MNQDQATQAHVPTTAIQRAELLNDVSGLPKLHYDVHAMVRRILMDLDVAERAETELREGLREIARGEGAFSRDRLTHCHNTVDNMKEIARALVAKTGAQ